MCYPILTLCDHLTSHHHQGCSRCISLPHKASLSPVSEYSINSDGLLCSICKQSLLAVSLMPAIQLTQLITLTRWLWCRQSEKLSDVRCHCKCGDLMHHFYYSPPHANRVLAWSELGASKHFTKNANKSLLWLCLDCPVQSDKFHQTRNYLWAQ